MQPFVNPYLFQNPYCTYPGNNISQNTQNYSNPTIGLSGKYVNDFGEITANDVPMGGQPAIFVKNDRNEIQLREWSPNGQIVSTVYKPFIEPQQTMETISQPSFDVRTEVLEPIFARLSEIEQQLTKLNKPTQTKKVAE